jgi:aryl sulfotransferase
MAADATCSWRTWKTPAVRYRSLIADSGRWEGFEHRQGDIIITTPPKCGTTWTQMLCALLVFDGPDFPEPLERMSPWLDNLSRPIDTVRETYETQPHRRFIKTHTPLDGLPEWDDVTYVMVGRDPRDVAISMEHHLDNMDLDRFLELRQAAVGLADLDELPNRPPRSDDPVERFRAFVEADDVGGPVTLASLMHHLDTGWQRRSDPNVALFHYADYQADLPGELLRLARALGIDLTAARAAQLAPEASLARMRERADEVVPSASLGQWKDTAAFLRAGASGEWHELVTDDGLEMYEQRVASLATADLAAWTHLGRIRSGIEPNETSRGR